jgi:hypothetical protein
LFKKSKPNRLRHIIVRSGLHFSTVVCIVSNKWVDPLSWQVQLSLLKHHAVRILRGTICPLYCDTPTWMRAPLEMFFSSIYKYTDVTWVSNVRKLSLLVFGGLLVIGFCYLFPGSRCIAFPRDPKPVSPQLGKDVRRSYGSCRFDDAFNLLVSISLIPTCPSPISLSYGHTSSFAISSMLLRPFFVLYGWSGGSWVIFDFVLNLNRPLDSCTIPFLNVVKASTRCPAENRRPGTVHPTLEKKALGRCLLF